MSIFRQKPRKTPKPLLIGVILIVLVVLLSSRESSNNSFFNLASVGDVPAIALESDFFADPVKKARPELPDFVLIQGNYLQSSLPAFTVTPQVLGALLEGFEKEDVQKIIIEYIVESGDTLSLIAPKFNVSVNTILWANNLTQSSTIKPGQKLIIPPVSGVIHYVKDGDTVSEIAKKYKAKTDEVVSFNELSNENDISIGDILVIPNGTISAPAPGYAPVWIPLAKNYFICPVSSPCRLTQGLHWYNAVDFSHGKCGEPIFAAAGGSVLKVKLTNSTSRWAFGGAGNNLTILHPSGAVTFYGHIASSFVSPGDDVSQGQIIALLGGQPGTPGAGKSTGCHLHFGVSGARNPFAR